MSIIELCKIIKMNVLKSVNVHLKVIHITTFNMQPSFWFPENCLGYSISSVDCHSLLLCWSDTSSNLGGSFWR